MKTYYTWFFILMMVISCDKKEEKKETLEVVQPKIEEPITVKEETPELIFTVQIASSKVEKPRFAKVENVNIYNEGEYIKYRLGEYATYKEATKNKAILRKTYNGAFVQALKNGKPIHIKEALGL